jgi:hypothetical protein
MRYRRPSGTFNPLVVQDSGPLPCPPATSDISHFPPIPLYPDQEESLFNFWILGILSTYDTHSEKECRGREKHLL